MIPALLLFLGTFGIYLTGAAPVLDGGDAGELIASSATLGVPHAPGYPLYQLLAHAAQSIVPFATASYRTHVFSALIGSFTLLLTGYLLKNIFCRRWVAIVPVLLLATRPLFIEQARVAEVFGLNALFAAAILLCLVKDEIPLAALLFGLGLGNHHTLLVLAPLLVLSSSRHVLGRDPLNLEGMGPGLKIAGATIMSFLLGLSVYVYLPIRAHAGPPVNFGDPETWSRFWAVVRRKEFGTAALHPAALAFRNGTILWEQTQQFFARTLRQWHAGGLILAAVGLLAGARRADRRGIVLTALIGLFLLGWVFEILSNLSPASDIGQWRLERFGLLPLLCATVLIAAAFEAARNRRWLLPVFAACVGQMIWAAGPRPDFRENFVFRDFALSTLRSAPANTRLVIDRVLFDEPTSSLLVTTITEHKRPDIVFYYRPGTLFRAAYGKDILDLSWEARFRRQQEVEARELSGASFPVRCLAFEKNNTPFKNPVLDGFLYTNGDNSPLSAKKPGNREREELPPSAVVGRGVEFDYPSRLIAVHFPYFMGKAAIERGDIATAKSWFNFAVQSSGGMAWLMSNLGSIYAQNNLWDDARNAFARAVELDPYFAPAQYGCGYVSYRLNRPAEMRAAWEKYLALDPHGNMAAAVRQTLEETKWK